MVGADQMAALAADGGRPAVVAVGGGSAIDAAKGIALAAVNPERGRDLDYRRTFAEPALPLVAVPTTAGTGTETNPFGVITDPVARRKFYVGGATSLPVAAILDPELTTSLPPGGAADSAIDPEDDGGQRRTDVRRLAPGSGRVRGWRRGHRTQRRVERGRGGRCGHRAGGPGRDDASTAQFRGHRGRFRSDRRGRSRR